MTSNLTDIVTDFLRARLDEDEAAAKAATAGPWEWDDSTDGEWMEQGPRLYSATATWTSPEGRGPYRQEVLSGYGYDAWGLNIEDGDKAHIARHDPARALREVEAKRNIIGGLLVLARQRREMRDHIYLPESAEYHSGHADGMEDSAAWALRLFAAVYSDHPDYDPAWAPGE